MNQSSDVFSFDQLVLHKLLISLSRYFTPKPSSGRNLQIPDYQQQLQQQQHQHQQISSSSHLHQSGGNVQTLENKSYFTQQHF